MTDLVAQVPSRLAPQAPVATASGPSPDPTDGVVKVVQETADAGVAFWDWFVGWPLQVLLILLVGVVVLALVRRTIRHVTERIAAGVTDVATVEVAGSRRAGRKARRPAFVDEALTLANPAAGERRAQRARTVGSILRSTADIVICTVMALMALTAVGVNVGPLLASAGVVGVALGFGAQSLVRDFISGIFILIEDQYGVGDVVDLNGAVGTVEEVGLRLTQVRSFDGTLWYVRNGEILKAGNLTQQWSRAVAEVRVPVDADVDTVRAALGRAADAVHGDGELAPHFLEAPSVRGVDSVTDFSMAFTLHAQVRPAKQWDVSRALLGAAQRELRAAGVLSTESPMRG
ncbi:mechanosensitive ion channel family protein [Xylanimonas oleitrophica]|uniref:Mechanosensitive ion channel family protein n=1 Tax=Xylanimonas oleitrophica TaxID=2607479 RepID=A0A2W5YJ50_9MICO|nr:mechanosensitive ion channel family protein [Xylanimonas oleitrophica]PZR55191.1 mechanosensitive ion channel family protein [Xylanimonas oleitrophica]